MIKFKLKRQYVKLPKEKCSDFDKFSSALFLALLDVEYFELDDYEDLKEQALKGFKECNLCVKSSDTHFMFEYYSLIKEEWTYDKENNEYHKIVWFGDLIAESDRKEIFKKIQGR